jgi:hypothetical protein
MPNLYIFEDMKMLGMKDHTGQWWRIIQDCVRCGECCRDIGPNWYFSDGDCGCIYLEKEADGKTYRCDLKGSRPFNCCGNSPFSDLEYCKVVLEKIDDPSSLL